MQTSGEVQSEEVDKCMHQSNSKNILFKRKTRLVSCAYYAKMYFGLWLLTCTSYACLHYLKALVQYKSQHVYMS